MQHEQHAPASSRAVTTRSEMRRARRRRARRRRLQGLTLAAVLAVALFAIPQAVLADEYRVIIEVDGNDYDRTTQAETVGELLEDERVDVGEHDRVTPELDTRLRDGLEIRIVRGCPVLVDVDGVVEEHGVTCDATVDEIVRELGLDPELVRTSRGGRIDAGETIVLRELRRVTVEVDGEMEEVVTTALTVGELLEDMGLQLRPQARIDPPPGTSLDGVDLVVVGRGGEHQEVVEEPIPFETLRREDPYLEEGDTRVVQEGAEGLRRIVYTVRTEDGVPVERVRAVDEVVRQPVNEVIAVGTEPIPRPAREGTTSSASGSGARVEQGGATWYHTTPGTCAHRTAPMGTVITVTNNASGATTTCTVADRGPFGAGRILDLSATVFDRLAPRSSGVVSVTATW